MFSVNFYEEYINYTECKWHVGNKNISNFNTISLTIWFGKARWNRLLKNCQNCSVGLLTAVEKSWIVQCWKGQLFLLLSAGGMGRAVRMAECPLQGHTAVEASEVRLSEIRNRTCFHSSSGLRGPSWTLPNHSSPKGSSKKWEFIELGHNEFGRRHGSHYAVTFNWV